MTSTQSAPATTSLPHPQFRLPFLGDILTVDFNNPCQGLLKEAQRHDGIFEQNLFGFPVPVVTGPELIKEVFNEDNWEKNVGHALRKLRPVAGDGLFTAYNREPNWAKAHNILLPAFTKSAMTGYHDSIKATIRELINGWEKAAHDRTWIAVPEESNRLTTEIIARAGFGFSFNRLDDGSESRFVETVLRELHYANRRTDVLPLYEKIFTKKRIRQHYADKKYARDYVDQLINERRRNPHTGDERRDMLDLMLTAADPETGDQLDDNNIGNQILTFLAAGSETSANAISFALHFLSIRPDIADKARAEIDDRWPGRDFPDIQYDEVAKLRYLRRVVNETLRLWPVAPGIFRQPKHDTTIGNGRYAFSKKKKDWVFVLMLAAHRDARWGPDANEFNPDRWLNVDGEFLKTVTYKPFGTGERACIGLQFALHEILIALAVILHQYELEPRPGYQLKVTEGITLKPADLRLRLKRRV
ncbi:cytochrome P450 [Mycobacteroides abscessus]|uniref:cytochrome P450 n=1 Tax=Mycobacteroides abscessus TaxID=36809 RepID=UPI000926E806|nr:cytochrome P450 [Mycobacteroides abscessus]SIC21007.1 cytochrome P450 [Mycobacteroides abscessus subsp. abscessus]